jgi:hypothetical protein
VSWYGAGENGNREQDCAEQDKNVPLRDRTFQLQGTPSLGNPPRIAHFWEKTLHASN